MTAPARQRVSLAGLVVLWLFLFFGFAFRVAWLVLVALAGLALAVVRSARQ